jgi:hypothetical protein
MRTPSSSRGRLALLAVLLVGLCLGSHAANTNNGNERRSHRRTQDSMEIDRQFANQAPQQGQPRPFAAGHEYTFTYNGQICTGLDQNPTEAGPEQQKSATRVQAQAKIQFHSDRHASLRLEQIRVGHLNEPIAQPQQVQPMGMFQQKQIDSEKRQELQLPCAFTYEEGVVARIQFAEDDSTWSKNIKRSVLNLIQLNLKCNNAQGLRAEPVGGAQQQQCGVEQPQQQGQGQQGNANQQFTKAFTLPETSIEGECQTTYTINKQSQSQQQQQQQQQDSQEQWTSNSNSNSASCPNCFNVTKSINFKQCSKIADVAYGYQTKQQQSQCAQCQQQWALQQQQQQNAQVNGGQQQQQQPHPCDQCDPKEVKQNHLDRTTVQRFVLAGQPEKYAIKRSELISQYVYKDLRAQAGSEQSSTMQAIVACELVFRSVQPQSPKGGNQQVQQLQAAKASTERDETLLFSNDWDVEEKRFLMYGDDEFVRNNPFAKVTGKVEQAQAICRKLIQSASNKQAGIEVEEAVQVQRLAEVLRMCTGSELQQIHQALRNSVSNGGQQQQQNGGGNQAEQQKMEQILADALAIAGTRNTIKALTKQILDQHIQPAKAAQTLKNLQGLPAPSDLQAIEIMNLCKTELVNRNPALKQSCWLTFGSMVGELCQHKTQKLNAQQSAFGAQSGFNKEEICPTHKKEIYKKALMEKFQQARSTYQKVLALKCLGNAGIDIAVPELEQIIKDKRNQQRIPRIQAIDALRRLRTQMPRKIQRILLPLFQNTREHPEVRMACFSMIMNTQPEQQIVDQIAYTLAKESSSQVQSFVYTTCKALSESKVPAKQALAHHLKSALKLANVDESTLRGGSRKYQVPIYSDEQKEGVFLTLTSVVNSRNVLPSHLSISLESLLNGEYEQNSAKVGMTQSGIGAWYEQVMQQVMQQAQQYVQQQQQTRGQRSSNSQNQQQQQGGSEQLRNIFSALGIKARKCQNCGFSSNEQQQQSGEQSNNGQEQPAFGMINLRIGDVDQAMLSIDSQSVPAFMRQILQGQKPSLSQLVNMLQQQPKHMRLMTALNLNEKCAKIATSMGVPLRVLTSMPVLASVEIKAQLNSNNRQQLESSGSQQQQKIQLSVHPSAAIAHIQRMETWMPIVITGVESVRCAEINAPIVADLSASRQKGLECTLKLPQSGKTRVLGLHTLAVTYLREFDPKTKMTKVPRVKNIHNEQLEQQQREVNKVVGHQALGMPFHIKGHFHQPEELSYKQLVQLAMCSENQVHITYEPTPESPRAIRLQVSANAFQKVGSGSGSSNSETQGAYSHRPELKDFYSNSVKFEHAYPEDFEDMQLEDHSQRRQKLTTFLDSFQPQQMYQHEVKLTAECQGGQKRCKAQMQVQANCDSKFKYCKCFVDAERTPMYAGEQSDWALKAKIQMLQPERVSSVQQLQQQQQGSSSNKQQKFVCQAECQWGVKDGSGKKQFINLRVQGEQAHKKQWRPSQQQIQQGSSNEQGQQQQQQRAINAYQKKTAFLNKFDMVADYKLQPSMATIFSRAFETLKAYNFWNTQQQANPNANELQQQQQQQQQSQSSSQQGQLYATVVIDPISQKHCNVSVKTPTQQVRIQSVKLPTQIRPFPLVRQQPDKQTHSVSQLFERIGGSSTNAGRAQCKCDGQRVQTFDQEQYKAPLSSCYSVLAKDCSNADQPQFSVLMKSLQPNQQPGSQQPKKIKVITPNQVITCEPKNQQQQQHQQQQQQQQQNSQPQQLKCKVNGQPISSQDQSGQSQGSQNSQEQQQWGQAQVEYDNDEQTSCTINVPGAVQVRFNGQKASISIANAYKNGQCGLCGHYNDQAGDDWRMPNDEPTDDLAQFHQSFTIPQSQEQQQQGQNGECTQEGQKQFYAANAQKFQQQSAEMQQRRQRQQQLQKNGGYNSAGSIYSNEGSDYYGQQNSNSMGNSDEEQDNEEQSWWGQPQKSSNNRWANNNNQQQRRNGGRQQQNGSNGSQQQQGSSEETEQPVKKTKVIEYSHMICFSTKPVKQCPQGTQPSASDNQQQQISSTEQQQQQQQQNMKKVPFACMPRSNVNARRLQRQARQGQVLTEQELPTPSFSETVKQPTNCVRY